MVTSVRKQRSLNQIKEDISIRLLREKLPQEWVKRWSHLFEQLKAYL